MNQALEELLATLPQDDQGVLRGQLEKHKPLQEGFLRQADYDRKMNTVKAERDAEQKAVAANNEKMAKYQKWYETEQPKFEALVKKTTDLESENGTLKKQVEEYAAKIGTGEEVDLKQVHDAIEARLSKINNPSQEDITRIVQEETKKAADEAANSFMTNTYPAAMQSILDVVDISNDHRQEFGEKLDRAKLAEIMKENQINDPKKAYEVMVAPRREEKKLAAAREEGKKEALNNAIPGSSGVMTTEMGHLQARRQTEGAPKEFTNTHEAAMAAAAELQKEGRA